MNYIIARSKLKESLSKYCNLRYYKTNLTTFLLVYLIIQLVIVILQVIAYNGHTNAILVARSAGILLAFNMSFTILLVLRRCLTWASNVKILRLCLPINDFIKLHKFIGIYIIVLSFVHTIAHCCNHCTFDILLQSKLL